MQDLVTNVPNYGGTAPQFNLGNVGNVANVGANRGGGMGGLYTVPAPAAEDEQVSEARQNLDKARKAVAEQARNLERVQLNVEDIAQGAEDEKKLSEFVSANYGWALNQPQPQKWGTAQTNAVPALGNMPGVGQLFSGATGSLSGNVTAGSGGHGVTTVNTVGPRRGGGQTWDLSSNSQTVAGIVSNGGLTMTGAGTVILSGSNGYGGTTTVSGGQLVIANASGSGLGGGVAGIDIEVPSFTVMPQRRMVVVDTAAALGADRRYVSQDVQAAPAGSTRRRRPGDRNAGPKRSTTPSRSVCKVWITGPMAGTGQRGPIGTNPTTALTASGTCTDGISPTWPT